MKNIWNNIALDDSKKHTSIPVIGQTQLISNHVDHYSYLLHTAAIQGYLGGNRFDRLVNSQILKIICNDMNPAFMKTSEERNKNKANGIEFNCADITY